MMDDPVINELSVSLSLSCLSAREGLKVWSLSNPLPFRLVIGQYLGTSGEVISHLNISRLETSDGGLYKCRAENSVGWAEHRARVNVYGE